MIDGGVSYMFAVLLVDGFRGRPPGPREGGEHPMAPGLKVWNASAMAASTHGGGYGH